MLKMDCKISLCLTYTSKMFWGFFTKKFIDKFDTTTSVSGIVTKFTFIRTILEDTIALHGKKVICYICIYQPETDTLTGIILKDIIALNGKK